MKNLNLLVWALVLLVFPMIAPAGEGRGESGDGVVVSILEVLRPGDPGFLPTNGKWPLQLLLKIENRSDRAIALKDVKGHLESGGSVNSANTPDQLIQLPSAKVSSGFALLTGIVNVVLPYSGLAAEPALAVAEEQLAAQLERIHGSMLYGGVVAPGSSLSGYVYMENETCVSVATFYVMGDDMRVVKTPLSKAGAVRATLSAN